MTQNLNGVTDQTSQQISTTVDHSEGTAVVESYSKSNSGLQVEFYESGSLAKTVDRKDEWVYDYTVNDSYSPTSAQGSKLGSWTHDWTETVTENGKTTTTADNNAQADNDSYAPTGSGGGFHWQAYFHQYQNLRPGNVLPTPPKPNVSPAANAGGDPSTYSNSIYKVFGENVIRPSFGDDFLANGSNLAVYGTYWATGMVGGLLAYFGGAAIISTSTIYGAAANGALWGGIEYGVIGGIMEIGSGGLVPDMTLEGLASSVAFGGIIGGGGKYLLDPLASVAGNIFRKVDDALAFAPRGGTFHSATGRATPIPLHNTRTPWYKFLSPKYDAKIWVKTVGRTDAEIARTWSHELQHFSDFTNHPGITHLAARKQYFPGSGMARYFLEFRGYKAGGNLTSLLTPLQSFSTQQVRWLGYDCIIFGAGGTGAVYMVYDWWTDG